ncbi:MAG: class I SAM-dependent methyltransferase [Planctomycetes bacterium]|nr:class I SAM-dependent methyltransferase [Planctomycetota bacterium]
MTADRAEGLLPQPPGGPGDPYARVDYRRLVAWEKRIAREGPWLRELLEAAPDRSVVDLGCGTGEHTAFFADLGARAVGIDSSLAMIAAACEHEAEGRGRFVLGDALDARALLSGQAPFGLALCLGNMLPHIEEDATLREFLAAVRGVLRPGGLLLVQLLNYRRILERGERFLPLDFRPAPAPAHDVDDARADDEHGDASPRGADDARREIVFLRILRDAGDGRILFFPTTLELDPDADEPLRVVSSRRVALRAWTDDGLVERFETAGFEVTLFGDMTAGPYVPQESKDLVLVARRR